MRHVGGRLALRGRVHADQRAPAPIDTSRIVQARVAHVGEAALQRRLARQAEVLDLLHERAGQQPVADRLVVALARGDRVARDDGAHLLLAATLGSPPGRRRSRRPPRRSAALRSEEQERSVGGAPAAGYPPRMARDPLLDGHGRRISDLRVSVTDRCNFRCLYCMPAEGLPWLERAEVLTFEEIERARRAAGRRWASTEMRLTGGEPLVRRDFPALAARLKAGRRASRASASPPTASCSSATPRRSWPPASTASTSSVDSLQRDRFYELTRRDALDRVLAGLEHLATFPEAHPIKVNAVAMRGFTEHEVLPFAALRPRAPLRGALHRVHAARRRPQLDARSWS